MTWLAILIFAASNNQYTPSFPGGLIAWWICNRNKRNEVGGWLMFYYWQLYGGAALTLLLLSTNLQSYVVENFADKKLYWLFVGSVVPGLILMAVEVAVASMLLSVRTWDMVRLLRNVMIMQMLAQAVGVLVDGSYFPDNLVLTIPGSITQLAWLLYWFSSKRVRHVFHAHDWHEAVKVIYPEATPVRLIT